MFQYKEKQFPAFKYTILICAGVIFVGIIWGLIRISTAFDFDSDVPHPSDDNLVQNFRNNEEDFNKLINMSDEDSKVERIAYNFTRVIGKNQSGEMGKDRPVGFSEDRWNDYRAIFDKLNLKSGLSRESDAGKTVIFLISFSKGMINSGSSKGYAYSQQELSPTVVSLDENFIESVKNQEHGVAYKKIKEHWYLSYDW